MGSVDSAAREQSGRIPADLKPALHVPGSRTQPVPNSSRSTGSQGVRGSNPLSPPGFTSGNAEPLGSSLRFVVPNMVRTALCCRCGSHHDPPQAPPRTHRGASEWSLASVGLRRYRSAEQAPALPREVIPAGPTAGADAERALRRLVSQVDERRSEASRPLAMARHEPDRASRATAATDAECTAADCRGGSSDPRRGMGGSGLGRARLAHDGGRFRRGEACALRWRHLDLVNGVLVLVRSIGQLNGHTWKKDAKTHQHRRIALGPETVGLLTEHQTRCLGVRLAD